MSVAPKLDKPDLTEFAKEMLDMCRGDAAEAQKQLHRRLKQDLSYWADTLCEFAAKQLIRYDRLQTRAKAASVLRNQGADRGLRFLFSEWDKYEWRLSNGVSLRYATKEDLVAEADLYRKQGRTMMARANWLESIAGRLVHNEETVEQKFSAEEVKTLYVNAESEWATR